MSDLRAGEYLVSILVVALMIWGVFIVYGIEQRLANVESVQSEARSKLADLKQAERAVSIMDRLSQMEAEQKVLKEKLDTFDHSDERYLPNSRVGQTRE